MPEIKAVITNYDLVTAYGRGIEPLWDGLLSKKSAIAKVSRFSTKSFLSNNAAIISELDYHEDGSLVMGMLTPLLNKNTSLIPSDAFLILATTVGEIDLLEKDLLSGESAPSQARPAVFLEKIKKIVGLKKSGMLISCACASSSSAIAQGTSLIRQGQEDCVLVVAADGVSEFVFSGFSSLMALDKDKARPFDKNRSGLSLGEAAGFVLLMSEERARKEKRKVWLEVAGWGLTCDANHMTGPSRDAGGLITAIRQALDCAGVLPEDIGCISAHGTGTLYNDSMEIKAFKDIFNEEAVPVYSIKGATGHTLGAAGLVETIVVLKGFSEGVIPATVNLEEPDNEACGWVTNLSQPLQRKVAISNNCGFGGINAALVLKQ